MTAWLGTFAIASTLWLGLAWLTTRPLRLRRPGASSAVWYAALLLSLAIPTLRAIGPEVFAGVWSWHFADTASFSSAVASTAPAGYGISWEVLIPVVWALVAAGLTLRYLLRLVVFRRSLRRSPLPLGEPARRIADDLSRRAGMRTVPVVTSSGSLASPVAFGVGRAAEVCLPVRALEELDDHRLSALLAHEIAHHMRWDPARLGVMNVLKAALWFQPLVGVAVRELRWNAETQCDGWAARSVDPLTLAECITEVARWVLPDPARIPVAGMTGSGSPLRARVERLLEPGSPTERTRPARLLGVVVPVLLIAPWVTPQVGRSTDAPVATPISIESAPAEESRVVDRSEAARGGSEHVETGEHDRSPSEHEARSGDEGEGEHEEDPGEPNREGDHR